MLTGCDFTRSFQLTHGPHSQAASYAEAVELEEHDAFAIALRDALATPWGKKKMSDDRRERKLGQKMRHSEAGPCYFRTLTCYDSCFGSEP